jgi:ABC-2 type transport system permease protein
MTTAATPTAGRAAGHYLADTATLIGRSIRLTRRDADTLLMAIVLPVMMMLLFVFVFGGAIDVDGATGRDGYVTFVVPGIILLCVGYGAATTAMSVARDMQEGMIDRLQTLPIRSSSVLTGHVVASVARNAVATVIVVAAAVACGFRPDATLPEWLAASGLLLLYVLALSWLAAALGLLAGSVEAASILSFFMLFLPYLSSAFVPTGTMPAVLRGVSEHQPVTPIIDTVRGLLTGTAIGTSALWAVLWSTGLLLVGFTAAALLFRRRTRR